MTIKIVRAAAGRSVEEHHLLYDGFAADAQPICRKVRVRVADCQIAQNRNLQRDRELLVNNLHPPSWRGSAALVGDGVAVNCGPV
jgi:hypothetical protein